MSNTKQNTASVATAKKEYDVTLSYDFKRSGHGQYTIKLIAEIEGYSQEFNLHCTDSELIDQIADLRYDGQFAEIQELYHSRFWTNHYEDRIFEWLQDIELGNCD